METVAGLVLIAIAFIILGVRQKRNFYSVFYLTVSLVFIVIATGIINTNSSISFKNGYLIALWSLGIFIVTILFVIMYNLFRIGFGKTFKGFFGEIKEDGVANEK